MRMLAGEVGNWVAGERFWGREKELERLLELLAEGANVSIIAQRRIGKTSLMREAGNRLPAEYLVLHIDLQDAKDAADMVVKLVMATQPHARLWIKTTAVFANILQSVRDNIESISAYEMGIQLRAGLSGSTWQEKGTQMLSELSKTGRPVVLFVDELPLLVNRMMEDANNGKTAVHALLTWLRGQALAHAGHIRMVFAGSIGLEPVLGRAGLSADINHLTPFLLDPWVVYWPWLHIKTSNCPRKPPCACSNCSAATSPTTCSFFSPRCGSTVSMPGKPQSTPQKLMKSSSEECWAPRGMRSWPTWKSALKWCWKKPSCPWLWTC